MSDAALDYSDMHSTLNSGYDSWVQNVGDDLKDDKQSFFTLPSRKGSLELVETLHPLWSVVVGDSELSFNKAIALRVRREGTHYFAENEYLDICGYGDSVADALSQAKSDLIYYFNYYSSLDNDELIGYGLEVKRRFLSLVS